MPGASLAEQTPSPSQEPHFALADDQVVPEAVSVADMLDSHAITHPSLGSLGLPDILPPLAARAHPGTPDELWLVPTAWGLMDGSGIESPAAPQCDTYGRCGLTPFATLAALSPLAPWSKSPSDFLVPSPLPALQDFAAP